MTDKGKGPETPVKIFMSNDDELQPGHTAHGASITGPLPGLFMVRALCLLLTISDIGDELCIF